ncbi:hypothetical protein E6P09_10815 [Haloferax mediterranei ATCC 33500]|uniref:Uncharacterized protein n=1 Tax=Haloferax mediterranei (strain ATCC 33500 / DSM 1411 / JCM 8866 / NBRC 14739 / NCIMB 2177 / R-4) TaxID=523841 RepID=I3R4V3_HALMT|nr:DUF5799 family protein [Haloferax mediterranei]AFK19263.1 hypothetical protein HFX_1556 [Haloferax mediterranei ATCC 33500]AHZ21378.1 hypothetical protein BM92_01345 [Haloferax mediterranei ATCC 33500]EMA04549.1 hypothetical protein C439_02702 [Haloferax mediterranei ATCC 33500]MDX5989365.1 DUF5799 family protein [Haloferax mediterranei ATCC 33500]QCQ75730.1 hypothetical protein E6P09_10815 [Haloferax mediterranei ATCC 33500]
MAHWTDSIVGDRMTVDREFNDQVMNSRFSSQEWGLIMTATEFEIEDADDPEAARIVAETEKVPQIIPELDNIRKQMGSMGGGQQESPSGGGGIVDSIKGALGLGDGGNQGEQEKLEDAERLTQAYAETLQEHLENKGKWEQVRISYLE